MRSLNGKTILVVDDEEDVRELIASELARFQVKVLEASGGDDALSIFQKHGADAIIADLKMDRGGGLELLEKLRGLDQKFPVFVVMTAGTLKIAREELIRKGAAMVLKKPFNLAVFVDELAQLLAARQQPLSENDSLEEPPGS